MKVTVIVASVIFKYLLYFDVSQANYSLKCPDRSHWKIRANSKCKGDADKYHCLFDQNSENITEFCASPKDYTAGFMAVYSGNIDADLCPGYIYMPINFKSNMPKSCVFLKSKCNGEGQLVHQNWSLAEDVTCTCDFSNGYAFIKKPKNNCSCVPSKEDCSCFKKECEDSTYVLSPDYDCLVSKLVKTQPLDSHNFQCHTYKKRIQTETCSEIVSTKHDCLSDVGSNCIKNAPCNDRRWSVKMISLITITIALACGLISCLLIFECLNEDGNKQIDICIKEIPIKTDAKDYFIIKCKHSHLQFYDGEKLHEGFDKKPRILDMCFVNRQNRIHLAYIDADNKKIVIRDISEDSLAEETLDKSLEPNRMCKIDSSTVAVIYKKRLHILIFDVVKMEKTTTYSIQPADDIMKDGFIQGIIALSQTELILSDKISLYRCKLNEENKTTNVGKFAPLHSFDTARRLTHVTVSKCCSSKEVIFVADENDKKLTSFEKTSTGNYIDTQEDYNRGLQNVRAIGATKDRVYAATSAGISVFCHEKGNFKKFDTQDNGIADYRMIVEYYRHVEHTRGLSIHLDKNYIYIGLSCIIKQEDVILIFKFKPDDIFK